MEENSFEKVIVAQLTNRFSPYRTGIFVTAFTTTGHWTLSSASRIDIIPSKLLFRSNTLNIEYLRLSLTSPLFPSGPYKKNSA
jgi:hypothetical protein